MIINLSFLNATNGMFWYSVDKIKTIDYDKHIILCSKHVDKILREQMPDSNIKTVSKFGAVAIIIYNYLFFNGSFKLITFTSHPLPFLSNQTIAFYDTYPFLGKLGLLKKMLFKIAVNTSKCRIGIINRSLSVPFLNQCGVKSDKIFFDSAFPTVKMSKLKSRSTTPRTPLQVGLVGTDSSKKNYDTIFNAVLELSAQEKVEFIIYGTNNDYYRRLCVDYKNIKISLISSDNIEILDYFYQIDYLISAAKDEGYGRPMGLAAVVGVPMMLLKSDVFMEFFGETATFFDEVSDIVAFIVNHRPPAFVRPRAVEHFRGDESAFFSSDYFG